MLNRRDFIERSLKGSSLFALGATTPMFVANAAEAAKPGGDTILVVVQLSGGNDGLNTVVPYADDEYRKVRPTLALTKAETFPVGDGVGVNNALAGLRGLHENGDLAVVQGVGYPNPNRSHFESMDVWHTADPSRKITNGWLGRGLTLLKSKSNGVPAFHLGDDDLPLAFVGSPAGVPSLNTKTPFGLNLGGDFVGAKLSNGNESNGIPTPTVPQKSTTNDPDHRHPDESKRQKRLAARKKLVHDVAKLSPSQNGGMLDFVRRTSLQTYTSIDRLQEIMKEDFRLPEADYGFVDGRYQRVTSGLTYELNLVARMIQAGFGTRIFYLSLDGFDTHGSQRNVHRELLAKLGTAVNTFYSALKQSGNEKRVVLMTFSEFGRRVDENGSRGTDHGSGSCLFVAGPAVKGGLVGKHPSLKPDDLDRGDLKFHTDFRRVYATLLDEWLKCDSRRVLHGNFEHVPLLKKQSRKAES